MVRLAIASATALRELRDGNAKPFEFSCTQHVVQCMRKATSKVDYVEALAH